MRVAIFIPSFRGGGAERVSIQVANYIASSGYKVDLVSTSAQGQYVDEVSDRVNVVDLGCSSVSRSLPKLIKYFKQHNPDRVLSFLTHLNIFVIVATKLAHSRARVVVSERNSLVGDSQNLSSQILLLLARISYQRAHHVIAVSKGLREQVISRFKLDPLNVTAIYNPVDVAYIQEKSLELPTHNWLSTRREFKTIIAVGRLTEQKNYPLLIKSLAIARKKQDIRLIILGEGELRESLTELAVDLGIENYLDLVGFQSNPFGWMRAADLYVLCSKWEGMPNTLLQALAVGVPVIATDCPTGPAEIIGNTDSPYAKLLETYEPKELAKEILDVVRNQKMHRESSSLLQPFTPELIYTAFAECLLLAPDK